jgi:hypothetical protein
MFRVLSSFNSRVDEFNVFSEGKTGLLHHQRGSCVPRIERVRFVPANWHLMTRFLGDVDGLCKDYSVVEQWMVTLPPLILFTPYLVFNLN